MVWSRDMQVQALKDENGDYQKVDIKKTKERSLFKIKVIFFLYIE